MKANNPGPFSDKVAGILLAAGVSSRMGRTKQLLPAGGGILLECVLGASLESDLAGVVLVLGHQADRIRSALGRYLAHPKLEVVTNRQYETGMSSSIITGLARVDREYDHVMILLGDIPSIRSELINHLRRSYLRSEQPIGAVKSGQKWSHPVMFRRDLYAELYRLQGDSGGRQLLDRYNRHVCLVDPVGLYSDKDIDTPEDYARFLSGEWDPEPDGSVTAGKDLSHQWIS
ncbi:MAG: hypothetical protein B5M55_02385 [Desulfococcus sp. 4484_242]|nr:MAG: hypothetical protein B5M55_02385 [Desulfococcus sp. 4484_242]